MTAIQKHAHANGAMYNADTMGYDPFPASFLPQLIEIAGFWKHDLTGNFNYDCSVSQLLATLSYKEQPVPPGVPYELPDPQHDKYYRCTRDFDIEDFVVPSNDKSDTENPTSDTNMQAHSLYRSPARGGAGTTGRGEWQGGRRPDRDSRP